MGIRFIYLAIQLIVLLSIFDIKANASDIQFLFGDNKAIALSLRPVSFVSCGNTLYFSSTGIIKYGASTGSIRLIKLPEELVAANSLYCSENGVSFFGIRKKDTQHGIYTYDGSAYERITDDSFSARLSSDNGCQFYDISDIHRIGEDQLLIACGYGGIVKLDLHTQTSRVYTPTTGIYCLDRPRYVKDITAIGDVVFASDLECKNVWKISSDGSITYFSGYRYIQQPTHCLRDIDGKQATAVQLIADSVDADASSVYIVGGYIGMLAEIDAQTQIVKRSWCLSEIVGRQFHMESLRVRVSGAYIFVNAGTSLYAIEKERAPKIRDIDASTRTQARCRYGKRLTDLFCKE